MRQEWQAGSPKDRILAQRAGHIKEKQTVMFICAAMYLAHLNGEAARSYQKKKKKKLFYLTQLKMTFCWEILNMRTYFPHQSCLYFIYEREMGKLLLKAEQHWIKCYVMYVRRHGRKAVTHHSNDHYHHRVPFLLGPSTWQLVRTQVWHLSRGTWSWASEDTEGPWIQLQSRGSLCNCKQPGPPLKKQSTTFNRAAKCLWQPNPQCPAVFRGLDLHQGYRDFAQSS